MFRSTIPSTFKNVMSCRVNNILGVIYNPLPQRKFPYHYCGQVLSSVSPGSYQQSSIHHGLKLASFFNCSGQSKTIISRRYSDEIPAKDDTDDAYHIDEESEKRIRDLLESCKSYIEQDKSQRHNGDHLYRHITSLHDQLEDMGFDFETSDYMTLLQYYCIADDMDRALDVLFFILQDGSRGWRITSISHLIHHYLQQDDFNEAMKWLNNMYTMYHLNPNIVTYTSILVYLISGYSLKMDKKVKKVPLEAHLLHYFLLQMDINKVKLDQFFLDTVINYSIRNNRKNPKYAKRLIQVVKKKFDVVPNTKTWNQMIRAYLENDKPYISIWIFNKLMKEANAEPNADTYTLMIAVYSSLLDMEKAEELLDEMKLKTNEEPNYYAYRFMIIGYCRKDNIEKVNKIFYKIFKIWNMKPHVIECNNLIKIFCAKGNMEMACKIAADMIDMYSIAWNETTYETLINGFCSSGKIDQAIYLLKQAMSNDKINLSIGMFNDILAALSKRGSKRHHAMLKMEELFSEITQNRLKPNYGTFVSLLDGYAMRNNQPAIDSILKERMREFGLQTPEWMKKKYAAAPTAPNKQHSPQGRRKSKFNKSSKSI